VTYRVVFTPEAEEELAELYHYIAGASSPDIAASYTEAIITYCEELTQFPHRGTTRDDIRPGLRTTTYKKRSVIAFAILDNGASTR
jgi:toxin ParE1/3/4